MNHADAYASSLKKILSSDERGAEKRVEAFVALLAREGKQKLLPGILRAYARLIARDARRAPHITLARVSDTTEAQKHAGTLFGETPAQVVIDDTLIGGWQLRHGSTFLDHSYKTALLSMYRSMRRNV